MSNMKLNYQKTYKFILKVYIFMQILFTTTYEGIGSLNKYDIRNILYIIVIFVQMFLFLLFFKFEKRKHVILTVSIVGIFLSIIFIIDGFKLNFLILSLFVLLGSRVDLKDIYIEIRKVVGFLLVFVSIGSFVGIFKNISFQRVSGVRYSFGFVTPNAFGAVALEYWLLRLLTLKKEKKIRNSIVFVLLFYLTFKLANSRTAAILMGASIVFYLYLKYLDSLPIKPILRWCVRILVVILPIFVIIFSVVYNESNADHFLINQLLSGRLYYSNLFLSEYDLTCFGTDLVILTREEALKLGETYKFLDCAFIYIAIEYGILLLGVLVTGYYFLLKRKMSEKNYVVVACILVFIVYGIFELGFFSIEINFTLLMLSELFHKKDRYCREN